MHKHGRLFSSLERQRLIYSIIEGEEEPVLIDGSAKGLLWYDIGATRTDRPARRP